MESSYESLEIVRIASGLRLFDGDSYQRSYIPPQGVALEPGLYIVHWPAEVTARRFDEHAVYRGPFADLERARVALSVLKKRLDARTAGETPAQSKASDSSGVAADEAAPRALSAGLPDDLARVIDMPGVSRLDLESRVERNRREEHEFVAEWAMC